MGDYKSKFNGKHYSMSNILQRTYLLALKLILQWHFCVKCGSMHPSSICTESCMLVSLSINNCLQLNLNLALEH